MTNDPPRSNSARHVSISLLERARGGNSRMRNQPQITLISAQRRSEAEIGPLCHELGSAFEEQRRAMKM